MIYRIRIDHLAGRSKVAVCVETPPEVAIRAMLIRQGSATSILAKSTAGPIKATIPDHGVADSGSELHVENPPHI